MTQPEEPEAPVGWRIKSWCAAVSISVPTFYTIRKRNPDAIKMVKVYGRSVVRTPPKEFLDGFQEDKRRTIASLR
ncbi:MAG: hypothetical protein WCK65_15170 [Rhodospirillaceae bacterium]